MKKIDLKAVPVPGMRNIKTALAVFICLLIYYLWGRDGVLLAAIAAIICLQENIMKTIEAGVHRVVGTVIGGAFGIGFINIPWVRHSPIVAMVLCTVGITLLIYLMLLVKLRECITIALVVYLIIALDIDMAAPVAYALNRVLDTLIGIVVAIVVNRFIYAPPQDIAAHD